MEIHKMDVLTSTTLFIFMAIVPLLWRRRRVKPIHTAVETHRDAKRINPLDEVYSNIQPLKSFKWKSEPVPLNATFKPKYHLTMGKREL
jgi:hypothetical protein